MRWNYSFRVEVEGEAYPNGMEGVADDIQLVLSTNWPANRWKVEPSGRPSMSQESVLEIFEERMKRPSKAPTLAVRAENVFRALVKQNVPIELVEDAYAQWLNGMPSPGVLGAKFDDFEETG